METKNRYGRDQVGWRRRPNFDASLWEAVVGGNESAFGWWGDWPLCAQIPHEDGAEEFLSADKQLPARGDPATCFALR